MKIANYIEKEKALRRVTYALYIYFFLLIFEGALRRWVLPGFSAPLLVVLIALISSKSCFQQWIHLTI